VLVEPGALLKVLYAVTSQDTRGFFEHCGYSLQSQRQCQPLEVRCSRYEHPDDPGIELGPDVALNPVQGLCRFLSRMVHRRGDGQ